MLHRRDRILTTHTGSLPRPPGQRELMLARERGAPTDAHEIAAAGDSAVAEVVARQATAGLDIRVLRCEPSFSNLERSP